MSASDFDFERLIQPLEPDTFLNQHWQQKPFILSRNEPNHYADLFSIEDLDSVIRFSHPKYPEISFGKKGSQGFAVPILDGMKTSSLNDYGTFDLNQVYQGYAEGGMVSIQKLQTYWQPIATFCRTLEQFFQAPVSVSAHLVHRDIQKVALHSHQHDAFMLQLEGCVHWRVDPASPSPQMGRSQSNPESSAVEDVWLKAGDLLYIPRGCLHEAIASKSSSLNLSVNIHAFTWADLIVSALASIDEPTLPLHTALPIGLFQQHQEVATMQAQFVTLLQHLTKTIEIQAAVDQLARRFIDGLQPLPDGHFRQLDDPSQVTPDTIVCKRRGMICRVFQTDATASIQFPGNEVKGPIAIAPALHFIANTAKFPVRDLPNLPSDRSKLVLIRRLIQEGLLTVVKQGAIDNL